VIPLIAVVGLQTAHCHMPRIWFPLFLLWIPVLLLSPVIFLVLLGLGMAGIASPWRATKVFWGILCALPGTDVRVCADGNRVTVRIL
jgi:hypothetical protein